MECLWHWAGRFAPQGDIGKYEDADISDGCFWDGEPVKLIDGLLKSGWIERDDARRLLIHDWHQHADEAVRKALNRANLPFLTVSRHCRDTVETLSAECRQGEALALALVPVRKGGTGENQEMTFEEAMERVDVQLRALVKPDFARLVFDSWDGRGGKDGAGVTVRFEKHLRKRWNREGEQWINGCHSAQKGKVILAASRDLTPEEEAKIQEIKDIPFQKERERSKKLQERLRK